MPIGSVIARARQRKRWTQAELARQLGVNRMTVVSWEAGKNFPLRNLGAIEEALDISLDGYEPAAEKAS